MAQYQTDILIVGAGAAGLACAFELEQAHREYLVLEARARSGGRILTQSAFHQPIELGAEFVHGAPPETFALLDRYGLSFVDAADEHLSFKAGRKSELKDFFGHMEKMMPSLKRAKDQTLAEFLRQSQATPKWKGQFRAFVEGFHAADLNLMGTKALALTEEAEDAELNGSTMFRVTPGYSRIVKGLQAELDPNRMLFNAVVRQIDWEPGAVEATVRSRGKLFSVSARKAVITIPISILKAKQLLNPPIMHVEQALSAMEMGHVQRLVFTFRERFWERLASGKPVSFLHGDPARPFPVWWTQAPLRTHHLVAWQGGPKALAMSNWPKEIIAGEALTSLAKMTGISKRRLSDSLSGVHSHNWSRDKFSRGAYSYIRTNGIKAARLLARPAASTIWFAGEGACFDSSKGTVHGALRSGRTAARELLGQ